MEKEIKLKKLSEIEGHPIERKNIPDYIDQMFAREKNKATDYIYANNIKNNETLNEKNEKKRNKKGED